jgi:hypothetical protein
MKTCLSEKAFEALINGSASAEQLIRWKRHLQECDSCAAHFIVLQTGHNNPQKATTDKSGSSNSKPVPTKSG